MTVHAFQPRAARQQSTFIELKPAYFKVDYDRNAVTFTQEGGVYYRAWFSRFGFKLDETDARGFFEAVQFINREVSGMQPEALERKLMDPSLDETERSLWGKYVAGDMEAFAAELKTLADTVDMRGALCATSVVSIR